MHKFILITLMVCIFVVASSKKTTVSSFSITHKTKSPTASPSEKFDTDIESTPPVANKPDIRTSSPTPVKEQDSFAPTPTILREDTRQPTPSALEEDTRQPTPTTLVEDTRQPTPSSRTLQPTPTDFVDVFSGAPTPAPSKTSFAWNFTDTIIASTIGVVVVVAIILFLTFSADDGSKSYYGGSSISPSSVAATTGVSAATETSPLIKPGHPASTAQSGDEVKNSQDGDRNA